jgi:hypothetical protein
VALVRSSTSYVYWKDTIALSSGAVPVAIMYTPGAQTVQYIPFGRELGNVDQGGLRHLENLSRQGEGAMAAELTE